MLKHAYNKSSVVFQRAVARPVVQPKPQERSPPVRRPRYHQVELKQGRDIRRDLHDRWWCSLPCAEFARMAGLSHHSTVLPFHYCAVNMINTSQEPLEVPLLLDLISDYMTTVHEPTKDLNSFLLRLLPSAEPSHVMELYCMLQLILQYYSPSSHLPFTWDELKETIELVMTCTESQQVYKLAMMVESLEAELMQHSLMSQRHMAKSMIAKWFNPDSHLHRLKFLTQSLSAVITLNELEPVSDAFLQLAPPPRAAPKALVLVQRLLQLAMVVSRRPHGTTGLVVRELSLVYMRLPSLHHRQVMLETLTWPVVRLLLIQRLLEDQCGVSQVPMSCLTVPVSTIFKSCRNQYL